MKKIYRILVTAIVSTIDLFVLVTIIVGYFTTYVHPQIPFTNIPIFPRLKSIYVVIILIYVSIILPIIFWQLSRPKQYLRKKIKDILNISLIVLLVLSIAAYFFIDEKINAFIGSLLSVLGLIIPVINEYTKRKTEREYNEIIISFQEQNKKLIEQSTEARNAELLANIKNDSLQKLLGKINLTLEKEHISKQDLINNLEERLDTILLQKYNEPEEHLIQKKLLDLGFKTSGVGIYILPPVKAKFINPGFNLKKWIKKELLGDLPDDYKYIIKFALIVDFKKIFFDKKIVKNTQTLLDVLEPEDIMNTSNMVEYLKTKKNISIKDIIEIPNLAFLVEDYLINATNFKKLREQNDEIVNRIKHTFQLDELHTTDIQSIDEDSLSKILKDFVSQHKLIASRIKENANFWKANFEKRL